MPLDPSTRVGAYEIVTSLGAGGMGEVYRARDTRLGREVALKVLPLSRHDDPELMDRFEREARLLAALNDSHIAAIYDVVTVGDHRAIVMELVAGETLTEVIARGPVPLRLALRYAADVSHALAVAHAAGIVHRDLKPGNIMITPAGTAKVLDFGIAKLQAGPGAAEDGRTITAGTRPNMALGTPAYMSPEQAHGRPVDARSDIFSLGLVMFEMISARRAFDGESTAAVLSSILRDDPAPLRVLVPATPRAVERCVARCMEKDPARRYQHASDLEAVLEDLRDDLGTGERPAAPVTGATPLPASNGKGRRRRSIVPAAIVIVAVAGFAAGVSLRPSVASHIPRLRPFITEAAAAQWPVWSPDGRTLAYFAEVNGEAHVFLRAIDAAQSTQLTTHPVRAGILFWSPDGSRLYFTRASDATFVSVSAGGGEPAVVPMPPARGELPAEPGAPRVLDACIRPDGRTIVYVTGRPSRPRLQSLDVRTGEVTALSPRGLPDSLAGLHGIQFSRDGADLALFASNGTLGLSQAWIISWSSQSARQLFRDASYRVSDPGISWLPDDRRFIMSGEPVEGGSTRLLLADVQADTLTPLTLGKEDEGNGSVSPDGARIAFVSARSGVDLIQFPLDGGPPEPILATSRSETLPDMSRSGVLAYLTDAAGPHTVRVRSGSEAWPRTIVGASAVEIARGIQPHDVRLSPDAQRIAVGSAATDHLIWIYSIAGGTPVRLDSDTTDQHGPSWSPDGNWIAYRRMKDGKWELVKAPLGGGPVVRLDDTTLGGALTDWSSSGDSIVYPHPDGILHLISPDGSSRRALAGLRTPWFRFSRDGTRLFALRRGATRAWELSTWDVATARELRVTPLPLAGSAIVEGMAVSQDGSRIILGAGTPTSDIWILEDFEPPSRSRWLPW